MKIFLMGNPNVGKSAVFNRLTGANVIVSNYAGTTVEFTKGNVGIAGRNVELIDVPGTYTLYPSNKAERIAVEMLKDIENYSGTSIIELMEICRKKALINPVKEDKYPSWW